MIKNFKFKIKNLSQGITLVELAVVIFIIVLFSIILISDFPKIQRQFALSNATYKLSQDIRSAQDLASSGLQIKDVNGNQIINIRGYGVYVNLGVSATQYVIYADMADAYGNGDYKYDGCQDYQNCLCNAESAPTSDCVVDVIDISKANPSLLIEQLDNITGSATSINFNPPGPVVNIDNYISNDDSKVGIMLENFDGLIREVWINKSGLISVQ